MRFGRAVVVGQPHHITQRGNYGRDVFLTDGDRTVYLEWLLKGMNRHGVQLWSYCLMSNHVHFLAVPLEKDSFARCFAWLHMKHSQRLNKRSGERGHLWQGRFFSCVLDEPHAWATLRYIECNPVRAGLVQHCGDYRWSSAAARCVGKIDPLLSGRLPA